MPCWVHSVSYMCPFFTPKMIYFYLCSQSINFNRNVSTGTTVIALLNMCQAFQLLHAAVMRYRHRDCLHAPTTCSLSRPVRLPPPPPFLLFLVSKVCSDPNYNANGLFCS